VDDEAAKLGVVNTQRIARVLVQARSEDSKLVETVVVGDLW
jgi:hypothetical protein